MNMDIEIVDLPINSMVVFHSYVSLPEGVIMFNIVVPICCGANTEGWTLNYRRSGDGECPGPQNPVA